MKQGSAAWRLLVSACVFAGVLASAAAAVNKPPVAKPPAVAAAKPPAKPAPAAAEGYTVAPAPAWVLPMAADPAAVDKLAAAPVQVLLMDHQTRVGDAAGTWRYQHAIRKINDSAGLQAGAQVQLDFDPSYQTLVVHRLEIWRDGKRIDKLSDRKLVKLLHRETQLERQVVDGRMTASIVLDDLRVGDRVEWAASLVGANPVFKGRFVDRAWTSASLGPMAQVSLRLLAPAERRIRHQVKAGLGIEVAEQALREGWRETWFRRRAVPQFHYDPLMPPADMTADQIELSEFADWADVANWAGQLFARADTGTDALKPIAEDIRAKARELGDTPLARLQLALDFVQREIRYFGTEMGANSHQPAAADQVLRQRFGDCKDKAALLVNLLKRLEIESASPVLVSAYSRGAVAASLPSPLAFDHAIVAVKLPGQDQALWLDATRSQQQGSPLERQSFGLTRGLLAREGESELSALPLARDALRSETVDTFRFPRLAEEGRFESVITYHGDAAEWLRSARDSMPAEELQKALIGEISRVYPSFSQDGPARIEEVEGRNSVKLSLAFRTGVNYWRFADKRMLVGDFALLDLIAPLRLPNQTPRSDAMQLHATGRYNYRIRYEFGEEVFAPAGNSRFDEINDNFALRLRYAGDARSQQIDGELRLLAEAIPAGQWTAYRDQLNKVWPKLANTLSLPVMSPGQITALRTALNELSESLRRGSVKVVTADQVAARSRLIITDHQLQAERLPPKARAQVLVERGVQLDHLGKAEPGRAAFEQALKLDPGNAEAHGALAINALMRGQDGEARGHADRALQLAPNDTGSRYARAWANYFAGQLPDARDELKDILQSGAEVERSYGSIWLYLVSRRLGEDAGTAAKALQLPQDSKPAWPFAVLQLMQGRLDLEGALAAAREDAKAQRGRECELYFYAAQKALADQDLARARTYLRKSLDTGVVEFNEYSMARRELDRIGAR